LKRHEVGLGLVAFVVTALVAGLALPGEWQVERELIVRGPSSTLNETVVDLSTWTEWSQWRSGVEPGLQIEYPGSMAGVGAVQTWQGGADDSGLLRITEVDARGGIRFDLERGSLASRAQLLFEEFGSDTRVVWREEGDLGVGPISGWRALMLDGLLGPGIERQLAGLYAYTERAH